MKIPDILTNIGYFSVIYAGLSIKKFEIPRCLKSFPFHFPLTADSLDVFLHPIGAVSLHLIGHMAVHIQGKSGGCMA